MTRHVFFLAIVALVPSAAFSDGLLYRLPRDGHWVRYDMEGKGTDSDGKEIRLIGTLTMSSVGSTENEGRKCRWIEIVMDATRNDERFVDIRKLLFPEEHLARGKEPLKHVVKVWVKHSLVHDEPQEIQDPAGTGARFLRELSPMLHGPFTSIREQAPSRVKTKIGQLDCAGIAVNNEVERIGGPTFVSDYDIRLHDKVPFGVVTWVWKAEMERLEPPLGTMLTKLTIAETGTDAKSVIPEAQ